MSTSIGSVTLDRDMVFEDEYNYSLVNSEVTPTIGGGVIVQEFEAVEAGRNITLSSTESQGLQLKSTIDALKTLADAINNTYALTITSNSQVVSKTVRFRNEMEGGPVQFQPMQVRGGLHSDDIWYKGTIHLMVM